MRQGAFGLGARSSIPGDPQPREELIAPARSAAKFGGFYATHLRSE